MNDEAEKSTKFTEDREDDVLALEQWESQWAEECNRRLDEIHAGKVKLIPLEEEMQAMKEKYG